MKTSRHLPVALALSGASLLVTLCGCGELAPPEMMMPPPPPPPAVDPEQLRPSAAAVTAARARLAVRPYEAKAPAQYNDQKNWPLIVLLHGYGANGVGQDLYFGLSHEQDRLGFLIAFPDGTLDSTGKQFWNATDVCCDFEKKGIDDVGYIDAIIDDMADRYRVDRRQVFLVGHSNGGFMSHRYACDRADRIAAIVSLAGDNYKDAATRCKPTSPVAVRQVHGDMDTAVPYPGGTDPNTGWSLPSALQSVGFWAGIDGCSMTTDTSAPDLDLDQGLPGADTGVTRFPACKSGTAAELWTIRGGSHVPNFVRPDWANSIWAFLSAHPKSVQ